MLKLKYLFDNRDLAMMILDNWEYDEDSIELFKYYRISSNAIYPFKKNDKLMFLRFVPVAEKEERELYSEIQIIETMKDNEFPVPNIVGSKRGEKIVKCSTPWGEFYSVVFEGVGVNSLENTELTEELCFDYGKLLAKFHTISNEKLKDQVAKKSVFDILKKIIIESGEAKIIEEASRLQREFLKLKNEFDKFGLIHYDFELDNIMFDEKENKMYAIDFDDSMYGFFGQDIERAINSIENESDENSVKSLVSSFLKGYESEGNNTESYVMNSKLYKEFAQLYSYVRVNESLKETWENEPQWMCNLRNRLGQRQMNYLKNLNK